ncbi:hypothetical protein MMC18_006325 [Xylographa bjoerkii]|nr:hypothetical protein [Xylographa bjoerkii]
MADTLELNFDRFITSKFPNPDENEKFFNWYLQEDEAETIALISSSTFPAAQFWTHLNVDWDDSESLSKFYKFIVGKAFEPLGLGSLDHNGVKTTLMLDFEELTLMPPIDDDIDVDLKLAVTSSFAIRYDDGNPLEDEGIESEIVSASEALFRFKALGWIKMRNGANWVATGYVLVLDLQDHNAPWMVLASEYYNDDGIGDEWPTIPRLISCHDRGTPDIWPGDTSRTPVAKLEGNFTGHSGDWFGDDVVFQMKRTGGRTRDQ